MHTRRGISLIAYFARLDERQALRQRSWLKVVAQRGCVADAVGGRP